ncbi:DNA repair protein [Linderina pennispora]|uniref:DNA repair protein n=1 Tax=Linderina pennispora TaxID=61395 RepID=A0A1Y1W0Y8_9FUNG|nr:DNA repair protein [Linderina pennispora]ORX67199.1 DNA repair protein [Linderina pennispora]
MARELTDDQKQKIEENRKKALERLKATKARTDTAKPPEQKKRLRGSKMSTNYYEYNLTTMRDTKAGFIEEDPQKSPEKRRKILTLDEIPYDPSSTQKCRECASLDLDVAYLKVFKVPVCRKCIESVPDKYSLLTKTEAKDDYLLTDGELRDRERLPVWEKPNPHKHTWNNMLLYLREHLEAFAIEKWGGLEELDGEFARRETEKQERKERKYKKSVAELRKRTRVEEWERKRRERLRIEQAHEHTFEAIGDDSCEQKCTICGLTVEVEEF